METKKINIQGVLNLILSAVIIVLIFSLWESCGNRNNEPKTVTVTVPEQKGKFDAVKPNQKIIDSKKPEKDIQSVLNPQNNKEVAFWKSEYEKALLESKSMLDQYSKANDSLKKELYQKAIALSAYSQTFENDTIKIEVGGMVRGELLSMKPKWIFKSFKAEVPAPPSIRFRMTAGIEIGNTKAFDMFSVKANVGFQNAKGNTFTISADTDKRFWAGLSVPILTIRN